MRELLKLKCIFLLPISVGLGACRTAHQDTSETLAANDTVETYLDRASQSLSDALPLLQQGRRAEVALHHLDAHNALSSASNLLVGLLPSYPETPNDSGLSTAKAKLQEVPLQTITDPASTIEDQRIIFQKLGLALGMLDGIEVGRDDSIHSMLKEVEGLLAEIRVHFNNSQRNEGLLKLLGGRGRMNIVVTVLTEDSKDFAEANPSFTHPPQQLIEAKRLIDEISTEQIFDESTSIKSFQNYLEKLVRSSELLRAVADRF